jgi:5-(hydroxymethyl)furfural/furfural oxidase
LWPGLQVEVRPGSSRNVEQGRVMGGSSSIMGMVALRGLPQDYDEWAELGVTGWSWNDLLPHFKRIENDLDFDGTMHGKAGPVTIRRHPVSDWPPFSKAFADHLGENHPLIQDMNADFRDGVGSVPISATKTHRVSSAIAWLDRETRARPNLTVLTDCHVAGLDISDNVARGVVVSSTAGKQGPRIIPCREVILCAGALQSPAILMRAGIGPAEHLRSLGIPVVADRPGVGANLQNHASINLAAVLKPEGRQASRIEPWPMAVWRFTSDAVAPQTSSDMLMFAVNKTSWHALGRGIASLSVSVYKAYSRGSVRLESPDPRAMPKVDLNLLGDERDVVRLIDGLRRAWAIMHSPRVAAVRDDVFAASMGSFVRKLHSPSWRNAVVASVIAWGMGMSRAFRAFAAGNAGTDISGLLADDAALRKFVLARAIPLAHYCGSCRMGVEGDSMAVVDSEGRVFGVQGLRVVDGSILPSAPRANTNMPIMMAAERIASRMVA